MFWSRFARLLLAATLAASGAPAQESIPLCPGLTIAGTVSEPEGDYEPLITVAGVDTAGVHLRYTADVKTRTGAVRKVDVRRTVRIADLDTATLITPWFNNRAAVTIPGTTAIGASRAVLRALKTTGTARVGLFDAGSSGYPARRDVQPNMYQFEMAYTLHRAAEGPLRLPVLVNGVPANLPVIHARGEYMGDRAEFFFLDDDTNPLRLRFAMTSGTSDDPAAIAQVVKISYRCPPNQLTPSPPSASPLERSLLQTGRAEVYDVYFDFNSDRIREQSEPTLREIAELLRRHPDWRLAIEGHTDSIAGDRFNLELSARRAAAVKAALTGRHGVAAGRLTTSGAGEGRPKDRNDTPEGRARNRRVELVRLP
jgi:outer membrane protein OmpA-like peptidoglycan-associated protein